MSIDDERGRQSIRSWIEQQFDELGQKSYYQLLGIERDADERQITTAYYAMVARFHPDLYGDALLPPDVRSKLVTLYSRLVEGYRVLNEAGRRAQYGRMLERGRLRWSLEDERAPKRDVESEIENPNARRFFKLGRAALATGDGKSAIMNLKLALSCEPSSRPILEELARAEALYKHTEGGG
jgi:curved DNA-binding protein CbpA